MVAILILVLVAAVLIYLAATYLPQPINWIVVLIILALAIIAVFGGAVDVDAAVRAA
jgi:hypothetical protein